MPDYGEKSWIERGLEQIETPLFGDEPAPNYGTALLETSATQHHQLSGGRRLQGGIMYLPTYRGPTVNVRVPKWTDNVFWIRASDYQAAQWIADALFYHTGRPPFHFGRPFSYPPLVLGNGQCLRSRVKCAQHVAKIAKGSALLGERGDYRARVKKLILEALELPEVVHFLSGLRLMARPGLAPPPLAIEEAPMEADSSLSEEEAPVEADSSLSEEEEPRTPMEVDSLSEEAVRLLAPPVQHVDAATVFRAEDMAAAEEAVNVLTTYIPAFGMAMDEPDNPLQSFGQSIGYDCRRKATIPSNLAPLIEELDEEEADTYKYIKLSEWEPFSSPRSKEPSYTFRY